MVSHSFYLNIILQSPMEPLYIIPLWYTLAILVMMGFACGVQHFLHSIGNRRRTRGTRDLSLTIVYAHHPEDGVNNGVGNAAPAIQLIPR